MNFFKKNQENLAVFLKKAGMDIDAKALSMNVMIVSIVLNSIITLIFLFRALTDNYPAGYIVFMVAVFWLIIFMFIWISMELMMRLVLDLKIYQRKTMIEQVLPDYLQLAAANIKSGMTTDKALWYAVRPGFGVLAKEIEIVAKQTMSGEDIDKALEKFADKYNSDILKRAISLIVEGIRAGGEIGDLLNTISINIQETQLLREEMAASVTTYTIFITSAAVVIGPILYALSYQLLIIVEILASEIDVPSDYVNLAFGVGVTASDFMIFSVLSLMITSIFSAMLVSIISKGNVKAGIKYIPVFLCISLIIFFAVSAVLSKLLGGFF